MVATWTAAKIAEMHRLAGEGLSASKIAAEMGDGVTRNAVIGKMNRVGSTLVRKPAGPKGMQPPSELGKRADGPPTETAFRFSPAATPKGSQGTRRESAEAPHAISPVAMPVVAPAPVAVVAPPAPVLGPCTITDLTDYRCKWPIGDHLSESFRYCGSAKPLTGPYCSVHAAAARGKPTGHKSVSVANFKGKLRLSGAGKA